VRSPSVANASARHTDRLCTALRRYLAAHPHAADMAQGIVGCWLPSGAFPRAADDIDAALARLVAERWLYERRLPGGNILYVANPERCST
jgi:hypothetical protein